MDHASQQIKSRHIKVCLKHDVQTTVSNGLEKVRLTVALPDFLFSEMDLQCEFLGKTLSLPLLIAPLTGGCGLSRRINRNLAEAAERMGLAMAVGSQKLMLDNISSPDSYLLRDIAPNIPLLANVGLVHVKRGKDYLLKAVESIEADGLILYINPLHEVLQEGGEKDFRGLLEELEKISADFPYPIMLKEVGTGIPESVVKWAAAKNGIRGVDVAGLGGTNWARIEGLISGQNYELYESLGIETAESILIARKHLRDEQYLIASGGIRNGVEIAKALAMGANLVSMALPFLLWASHSLEEIIKGVSALKKELQVAMWCMGSINIKDMRGKFILRK
ncbi:type 2 isopentenyl-diphosphate Delta-isomerase [Desulfobacterium sp. N47]